MQSPLVSCIVPGPSAVQNSTIVPDDNIANRPFVCVDKGRLGRVVEQTNQKCFAFALLHALDLAGMAAGIERFASIDRVAPDHGMTDG